MTHRTKCLVFLVITAILWSAAGVIIKSVNWNPGAIASVRGLAAAITISLLAHKNFDWSPPDRSQWILAGFMAMICFAFVTATKLTTAANAILLQYTAPVWVALAAPLILRERTSGRDWFFIIIAFSGMALFFKDNLSSEGLWGILVGFLCGIFFAGLAISLRYARNRQPMKSLVLGNLLVASMGLIFCRPPWPSAFEMMLLVLAGVIQIGLAYYLFTLASSGVSSLEMVLITALEPILNPIWVFLVIGERPGFWALIGGAIVLTTITAWSILKTLRPSPGLQMD